MASTDSPHTLTTYSGRPLDLDAPAQTTSRSRTWPRRCRRSAGSGRRRDRSTQSLNTRSRSLPHVPPELKLAALDHDSHEAFACDLPTPLKALIRTDSDVYDELCSRLDAAIGSAFGIDPAAFKDPAIKHADETVRVSESHGLLADGGRSIRDALPHRDFRAVTPIESSGCFARLLDPAEAQEAFLAVHRAGGDVAAAI